MIWKEKNNQHAKLINSKVSICFKICTSLFSCRTNALLHTGQIWELGWLVTQWCVIRARYPPTILVNGMIPSSSNRRGLDSRNHRTFGCRSTLCLAIAWKETKVRSKQTRPLDHSGTTLHIVLLILLSLLPCVNIYTHPSAREKDTLHIPCRGTWTQPTRHVNHPRVDRTIDSSNP